MIHALRVASQGFLHPSRLEALSIAVQGFVWGSGRTSDADARRRNNRFVILPRPEPAPKPVKPRRRRVTEEAIDWALALPWAGLWNPEEARAFLPMSVPVEFETMNPASMEALVQAIAMQLADEHERRIREDDEEVMLLLAAM